MIEKEVQFRKEISVYSIEAGNFCFFFVASKHARTIKIFESIVGLFEK